MRQGVMYQAYTQTNKKQDEVSLFVMIQADMCKQDITVSLYSLKAQMQPIR